MKTRWRAGLVWLGCWLLVAMGSASGKTVPDHWVGTWAAAPFAADNAAGGEKDRVLGASDVTLRQIVHVSRGGTFVRVVLTNEFGTEPLQVGEVHVALSAGGSSIGLISANKVRFGGKESITIPAGALAESDGFALSLPAFADVAVSIFLPAQTIRQITQHGYADQTNYLASGNVVGKSVLDGAKTFASWEFLKGIDVRVPKGAALVAFGDSITDGALSTQSANARYPDLLAKRLLANKKTAELGVLNEGIGGNRILHDGTGPNALARFDRDVIGQAGVKYCIVLEGINDLGAAFNPKTPHDVVSAEDLIDGFRQMAKRAHAHGIKIIGATLTPYGGAGYSSPDGERARQALNAWIRQAPELDGVIDFDKATQDPANPVTMLAAYDSGDHLHPKDAGYKAMAEAVDLKLFEGK